MMSATTASVDALLHGHKVDKPRLVVLRISKAAVQEKVTVPVYELLLGPIPSPEASSSSAAAASSSPSTLSWQLPALLLTTNLNVLASEDLLSAGTVVVLSDYDVIKSEPDGQVVLKVRKLEIAQAAPGWMTMVFEDDFVPAVPGSSALMSTTSPDRPKQIKRKSESPKKKSAASDDDDVSGHDSRKDEDDDDDSSDRATKRVRRRNWAYLYDLDAESDHWRALVRVAYAKQDESGQSSSGRDDWQRRSLILMDGKNQVMSLDIWKDLLPTFSSLARPGRLLVLNELNVKRITDRKPWNIHDHELVLDARKERRDFIEAITDEEAAASGVAVPPEYKVTMISELGSTSERPLVNVVAVVLKVGDIITFKSRSGYDCQKRMIRLMDASKTETDLTIMFKNALQWGPEAFGLRVPKKHDPISSSTASICDDASTGDESADVIDYAALPIIYLQNSKVNRYNGSLSLEWVDDYKNPKAPRSCIWVRPDEDEQPMSAAIELRNWLDEQQGKTVASTSISNNRPSKPTDPYTQPRLLLSEIKNLRPNKQQIYFTVRVTVATILHNSDPSNVYYIACPVDHGTYQACREAINMDDPECDVCPQHGRQRKGSGKPTYRMDVLVEDEESSHQFRVFNNVAEQLLNGVTAVQMNEYYEANDTDKMKQVMTSAVHSTWGMLCSASMSPHAAQDIRTRIVELFPLDSVKEADIANRRLAKLKQMAGSPVAAASSSVASIRR